MPRQILTCILVLTTAFSIEASFWLYNRTSCTGLGDRLALAISLSALARLNNNATILAEWCTSPQRVLLASPYIFQFIPGWVGYDFPLLTVLDHISLPSNIQYFDSNNRTVLPLHDLVTMGHDAPAEEGIEGVSTLYWKALKLDDLHIDPSRYRQAYLDAGKEITVKYPKEFNTIPPYVLVHVRCPDRNSYTHNQRNLCTKRVIRKLTQRGLRLRLISNNMSMALRVLDDMPFWNEYLDDITYQDESALQDMKLVLGATAIVQHAPGGWSSYTSVPAMAKEIPLINTASGLNHRFDYFEQFGELPPELYTCLQINRFVSKVTKLMYLRGHEEL